MKIYELKYRCEASYGHENYSLYGATEDNFDEAMEQKRIDLPDDGWEKWSMPLGNGYMGANVFGRVKTERIQITENSLSNPYAYAAGGLNNFAELYLEFEHENITEYNRALVLNDALAYVEYRNNDVKYRREYFTSYPDKVLVVRLSADKGGAVSVRVSPKIPYVKPYLFKENDGMGKSGRIYTEDDRIIITGEMEYYKICFEGQFLVKNVGGTIKTEAESISVEDADEVLIIAAVGTNYRLESRVFTEENPKKKLDGYPHPRSYVTKLIGDASKLTYEELFDVHKKDYSKLFERTDINLYGNNSYETVNDLVDAYRNGNRNRYLEELSFQFGRYLLIASSRQGTYPANLQGIWNRYASAPWSGGYWHNINVQMNYWPSFNTNLNEMFEPYIQYFKAYLPLAQKFASDYISRNFPENHSEGEGADGWIIGTGAWLYTIFGMDEPYHGHSGPGTGSFTSKLFMDYYEFTGDKKFLEEVAYPAIYSMSVFLSKTLYEKDGKFLVKYSASPEQRHNNSHYYTEGCAFDQQMVYESYKDTLKAAKILGKSDEFIEKIKSQIDKLEPVLVGKSGQIKEFREEEYYGDIGEYHHRHISHLVGLYPGTIIDNSHPEWMKAAECSLNLRGDEGPGWSVAHKMNAWARLKNGNRTYDLLKIMLEKHIAYNLWNIHPPFQIDGNFGMTSAIAEMLVQSHEGFIHILPALPEEWKNGEFSGLTARGAFEIDTKWENGKIIFIKVKSNKGNRCKIFVGDRYTCNAYNIVNGFIEFETVQGNVYELKMRNI